jgi:cation transport regulator ChaC
MRLLGQVPTPAIAVFAYGSLVDVASASQTLGRSVERVRPAHLHGWRRRFSTARDNRRSEKSFARAQDGWVPATVLVLNIEPHAEPGGGEPVNGGLIEVGHDELARLDARELRYERVDVTSSVRLVDAPDRVAPGPGRVYAYAARTEHLAERPPQDSVVLAGYAGAVEAAFATLGEEHVRAYRSSTLPYPAPLMDGRLVGDDVPAGNPRAW